MGGQEVSKLERSCRIDFDGGHDRSDELEEDDKVKVDAHTLDLLFFLGWYLLLPNSQARLAAEQRPLLLTILLLP